MAHPRGIQDQVKFTGFVNQVKLMELYKNCTCLVMPSRVPETFGLSGLEAMSFQKPVVATNVGGISEWLHDNENGRLVKSNDAHSLAKALDSLLADREKAKNMGEKGYQIYQNSFLPRHHIEPLLAYFNEIIREESHDR
jgi:glycosyltransferase involved in cell wall biosynthesis